MVREYSPIYHFDSALYGSLFRHRFYSQYDLKDDLVAQRDRRGVISQRLGGNRRAEMGRYRHLTLRSGGCGSKQHRHSGTSPPRI